MSDEQIFTASSRVLESLCLMDQTVLFPGSINLLRRSRQLTDRMERIFWQMIFERWGGFDCAYPHFLYKAIIDGRFDPFLDDYMQKRAALIGEE